MTNSDASVHSVFKRHFMKFRINEFNYALMNKVPASVLLIGILRFDSFNPSM